MMLYLIAPLCIIQTIGIASFFNSFIGDNDIPMSSAIITFAFSLIGFALLNGLLWTLMRWDMDHDEPIGTLSLRSIARPLWRNTSRMMLVVGVVGGIAALLFIVSIELLLIVPALFLAIGVLILPLLFLGPAYTINNLTFVAAVKRSYKLGFSKLGNLIAISISLAVILFVFYFLTAIPITIITELLDSFSRSQGEYESWLILRILQYICIIITTFIGYYCTLLVMLSGGYLYGSTAQETEDVSLANDINNFENL